MYDCYIFNMFNSGYNIVWRDICDIELSKGMDSWEKDINNKCIKEYINNKELMGKDIFDNGMYMAFSYKLSEGIQCLKSGSHRYEGLKHYYKKCDYKNKKLFIFYHVEDYSIEKQDMTKYRQYIVPNHVSYKETGNDLYIKNVINEKYKIRDLEYDMCLIEYNDHQVFAIDAVAETVSPFIWRWNSGDENKDDKINAKEILNDMVFFFENKDNIVDELKLKLLN